MGRLTTTFTIAGFVFLLVSLTLIAACEFGDPEPACPSACTGVTDPDSEELIECRCPLDIEKILREEYEEDLECGGEE